MDKFAISEMVLFDKPSNKQRATGGVLKGKFNTALSLCRVLRITLYFFEDFLEASARGSAVVEVPQSLGVTMVCFLGQESSLQSPTPQQRHRLFSRHFLYLFFFCSSIYYMVLDCSPWQTIYNKQPTFLEPQETKTPFIGRQRHCKSQKKSKRNLDKGCS